jgi:hypothetical protein
LASASFFALSSASFLALASASFFAFSSASLSFFGVSFEGVLGFLSSSLSFLWVLPFSYKGLRMTAEDARKGAEGSTKVRAKAYEEEVLPLCPS